MNLSSLLFAALASKRGVRVSVNDPGLLRQHLYRARREDLPSFGGLSFIISPTSPDDELWLVKTRGPTDAQE